MPDFTGLTEQQLRAILCDPRVGEPYKEAVRAHLGGYRFPEADELQQLDQAMRNGTSVMIKPTRRRAPRKPKAAPRDGLNSVRLTIYGAPRTKKTSNRLVVHEGRHKVLPSAAWCAWRDYAVRQLAGLPWMRLRDQAYNCAATFYRDADVGDAVGYHQGLADVLEEAGVLSNDKWIRAWDGTRMEVDRDHPRVEITLTPLGRG